MFARSTHLWLNGNIKYATHSASWTICFCIECAERNTFGKTQMDPHLHIGEQLDENQQKIAKHFRVAFLSVGKEGLLESRQIFECKICVCGARLMSSLLDDTRWPHWGVRATAMWVHTQFVVKTKLKSFWVACKSKCLFPLSFALSRSPMIPTWPVI